METKTKARVGLGGALFLTALFLWSPQCKAAPASEAVMVATVSIYDARIISQEANVLKIGFDLDNLVGVQSGIRYGVELWTTEGERRLVDQKVFSELITLGRREMVKKEIEYVAPSYLQGKFNLRVVSKNTNGLPFGNVSAGEVSLDGPGSQLQLESAKCFLQVTGGEEKRELNQKAFLNPAISLSEGEQLNLSCAVVNLKDESVEYEAVVEMKTRSDFGPVIAQKKAGVFHLKGGEEFNWSMTLPQAPTAGTFVANLTLKNQAGQPMADPIFFAFAVSGSTATIENVTFDKENYAQGETALVTVLWLSRGQVINPETNEREKITLKMTLVDSEGLECAQSWESSKLGGMETAQLPILKKCLGPQVKVSLVDAKGVALDEKVSGLKAESLSEESSVEIQEQIQMPSANQGESKKSLAFWLYLIAGGGLLLGVVAVMIKRRQHKMLNLWMLLSLGGLLVAGGAEAGTARGFAYVDGSGVVFVGLPVPADAEVYVKSDMTYADTQCGGIFIGSGLNVSHQDDSGAGINYRSGYVDVRTSAQNNIWTADDYNAPVNLLMGNGTLQFNTTLEWWRAFGPGCANLGGCDKVSTDYKTYYYTPLGTTNGACGSANGGNFVDSASLIASQTCSVGSRYNLVESGNTFTWNCSGACGGTPASCSATKNPPPLGFDTVDNTNCNVNGWAADPSNFNQSLQVHVYGNGPAGTGTFLGTATANIPREDVRSYLQTVYGVSLAGNQYGFSFPLRGTAMDDTQPHNMYSYAIDIPSGSNNPLLTRVGSLSVDCLPDCPSPNCLVGEVCVAPGTISYSCDEATACSAEEKCIGKPNRCLAVSSNGCPSLSIVTPSVCRANGVTCADSIACPCPPKNWREVAP